MLSFFLSVAEILSSRETMLTYSNSNGPNVHCVCVLFCFVFKKRTCQTFKKYINASICSIDLSFIEGK